MSGVVDSDAVESGAAVGVRGLDVDELSFFAWMELGRRMMSRATKVRASTFRGPL